MSASALASRHLVADPAVAGVLQYLLQCVLQYVLQCVLQFVL